MDYMEIALSEAKKAEKKGEVPIGCVIVKNGKIISKAHNLREKKKSATSHAEMLAINKACKKLRNWRLAGCEMYITLEPCPMCMGAAANARIDKVYYGAPNQNKELNHEIKSELLENYECQEILKKFFSHRR